METQRGKVTRTRSLHSGQARISGHQHLWALPLGKGEPPSPAPTRMGRQSWKCRTRLFSPARCPKHCTVWDYCFLGSLGGPAFPRAQVDQVAFCPGPLQSSTLSFLGPPPIILPHLLQICQRDQHCFSIGPLFQQCLFPSPSSPSGSHHQ